MKHKKIIYKSLFASIATLSLSNYANAAPCTADTSVTVSCEDLTLTNTSTPISVSNGATVQNNAGDYDLTGFFCARLNVVFFNLEEGVYEWRTRSMARSRRS